MFLGSRLPSLSQSRRRPAYGSPPLDSVVRICSLPSPRRGPLQPHRPRFDPMQVTQPICSESQNLSIAFTSLSSLTRDFFTRHAVVILNPSLPSTFSELSLLFDRFCKESTFFFDSQARVPLSRPGNELIELANLLVQKWLSFLVIIRQLADANITPYSGKGQQLFREFLAAVGQLLACVGRAQFLSVHLEEVIKRFEVAVTQCRQSFMGIFQVRDFGPTQNLAEKLLVDCRLIFEKEVPADAVPIRERFRIKSTMLNSCATLIAMLDAMAGFDVQIAQLKAQIAAVSRELEILLKKVNLAVDIPSIS